MSRLTPCFEALRNSGRKAVIPYIVAGDPTVATTVPMLHSIVAAGANVIELGVPFYDQMSEGPVIQRGHERALANDVSLSQVLGMVSEFRQEDQVTPWLSWVMQIRWKEWVTPISPLRVQPPVWMV